MRCEKCGAPLGSYPTRWYWKGEDSPNSHEDVIRGPDTEIYDCPECGHENRYYR